MLKKIRSVAIYVVCCLGAGVATEAIAMETGFASYYSDRFQGRKTASGEEYDRNRLTAAHKTLPIGSQIEVTNLNNHHSVIVTINDRGPYSGKLTIDLSYAAAKEIGLVRAGVAPVALTILGTRESQFEKAIPSEELFEFNQLAKAEEVEEAEEEEVVSSEKSSVPEPSRPEKLHQSEKKVDVKSDARQHRESAEAKKVVAKSDESKHKQSAKSDKTAHTKEVAKSDDSKHKHVAESEKSVTAKSAHSKHQHTAESDKSAHAKKVAKSEDKHEHVAKSDKNADSKSAHGKHKQSETVAHAKKAAKSEKLAQTKKSAKSKKS